MGAALLTRSRLKSGDFTLISHKDGHAAELEDAAMVLESSKYESKGEIPVIEDFGPQQTEGTM